MAFTDRELSEHLDVLEKKFWSHRRPPVRLRGQVREGQRILGHSIELFLVRPMYQQPGVFAEESIAKLTFVRTKKLWRLYWKRADGKWHGYIPRPEVKTLAEALRIVDEDQLCCFLG
ncbi:MAG: DUF3024 domain-containing protein [Verrucomicrobia bacterium]|nr:DUF3024 domain-containing protein [Verrucomicrobiota bacterium]